MTASNSAVIAFSPRRTARLAGFFFLLTIVGGIIAEGVISPRFIVSSDATATAANIQANPQLFQLGFTVYLLEMVSQIVQVALFYRLLRPAGPNAALASAAIELAGCTIKTFARVFYVAPLLILGGASYLSVFTAPQLQVLAMLSLKVNSQGAALALAFFGFSALLQGYLILRSTFLPKFLGWISVLGSVGWLTFLYPPLGTQVFPIAALIGLVGAVATIGWLLVKGADEAKWREQAGV